MSFQSTRHRCWLLLTPLGLLKDFPTHRAHDLCSCAGWQKVWKNPAAQSHQGCKLSGRMRKGRGSVGSALHWVLQLLSPSQEELVNVPMSPSSLPSDTAAKQHRGKAMLKVFITTARQHLASSEDVLHSPFRLNFFGVSEGQNRIFLKLFEVDWHFSVEDCC